MKIRGMISRLKDVLWREQKMIMRRYLNGKGDCVSKRMVFMADGSMPHGGMFDRLKGAISVYAASQVLSREFKIHFVSPFRLEKYLEPNGYDWMIDDVCRKWPKSRPVIMYGEFEEPSRLFKARRGETHFFYGYNSLEYINQRYGTQYDWGAIYNELFRPTPLLRRHIDDCKSAIGENYVAIHLRFLNLLGDGNEFACDPTLPVDVQERLKAQALAEIKKIMQNHPGCQFLLATDSTNFSGYVAEQLPEIKFITGEIKHIGTTDNTSDGAVIKMFLDYYMIAESVCVYNIVGPGMWPSAFPEYAAKIGRIPFKRVRF